MAENSSLLDQLRQQRNNMTEAREPRLFKIPGYGSALQAKYRVLSRDEEQDAKKHLTKQIRQGKAEQETELVFECGVLAKSCVGLYTERDEEVVALNEAQGLGEEPIRWGDERLVGIFDLDLGEPTARKIIEAIVAVGPEGGKRLEGHFNAVTDWMDRLGVEDDQDF